LSQTNLSAEKIVCDGSKKARDYPADVQYILVLAVKENWCAFADGLEKRTGRFFVVLLFRNL
jgi:hypothetical protein